MINPRLIALCAASALAVPLFTSGAVKPSDAKVREADPAHVAVAGQSRPARPTVSKVTAWGMTIRWRKVSGSSYVVFGNGTKVAETRSSRTTLTQLKCATRYRVAVAAVSTLGQSAKSKVITKKTKPCPGFEALLHSDMSAKSEVLPHGMDKLPFSRKPRVGAGTNAHGATAFTAWGQLYECKTGNRDPSARVEIGDIRAWIKSKKTGNWSLIQSSPGVDGGAYHEDFANDDSRDADIQHLPGGAISAVAGHGRNFHFWPQSDRRPINPGDIAGVVTLVRARLTPNATSRACYVLSMGADYWASAGANWGSNRDVGIGRFKRVTSSWRVFTMSTTSTGVLPGPLPASARELH